MTTCRLACEIPISQSDDVVTRWYSIITFGSEAKTLALVPKGQSICVYGRLSIDRWTTEQGQERSTPTITATGILCASSTHPERLKTNQCATPTNPEKPQ